MERYELAVWNRAGLRRHYCCESYRLVAERRVERRRDMGGRGIPGGVQQHSPDPDQVGLAVAIQVRRNQSPTKRANNDRGLNGAVAIAQQHARTTAGAHYDVGLAVAVQICYSPQIGISATRVVEDRGLETAPTIVE